MQQTLPAPLSPPHDDAAPIPASLAYSANSGTNPEPFLLTPILNLPPSFGTAYVGETFSCTLSANHDVPPNTAEAEAPATPTLPVQQAKKKLVRDVRIEAEMKSTLSVVFLFYLIPCAFIPRASICSQPANHITSNARISTIAPSATTPQKVNLQPIDPPAADGESDDGKQPGGTDLGLDQSLQKIVNYDLHEEGNHVLVVTVSYYEATETSGRVRTFRKLYQFICKSSLIVRTKVGSLSSSSSSSSPTSPTPGITKTPDVCRRRRWVMEAQLENCSEDLMQLHHVRLQLEPGFRYRDCNWEVSGSANPILHPGEVEQCCFVVEEEREGAAAEDRDGRIIFGVLGIGWRTEMGSKGFLSTGKLGTRVSVR